jgi:hypothetical protein
MLHHHEGVRPSFIVIPIFDFVQLDGDADVTLT